MRLDQQVLFVGVSPRTWTAGARQQFDEQALGIRASLILRLNCQQDRAAKRARTHLIQFRSLCLRYGSPTQAGIYGRERIHRDIDGFFLILIGQLEEALSVTRTGAVLPAAIVERSVDLVVGGVTRRRLTFTA